MVERFFEMVALRPYSFIPMGLFLLWARLEIGWRAMMLWAAIAYAVAFAAEWGSVNVGFPFGWYFYVQEPTLAREFWVFGVPFFDSMSFIFLSYWTFVCALWLTREKNIFSLTAPFPWSSILLGSFLMMAADIVIDPIALRGEEWFLGAIYGYPFWGPYFGITYENFMGWWLVGFGIFSGVVFIGRRLKLKGSFSVLSKSAPALWVATIAFNMAVAAYLHQWVLFLCDLILMVPIFYFILRNAYVQR